MLGLGTMQRRLALSVFRTVISLGAIGAMAAAGAFSLQDQLLYFPARASQQEMLKPGLAAWPSATDFRGVVAEPAAAIRLRGTAIVFHGNAGHATHRQHYADLMTPLGLRVILVEYPGYGPRDGKLGEENLVSDATSAITMARQLYGEPLLVIGESLGAGVAAAAVGKVRDKASALLLITPWDTLANVARHHYPWLPVAWILRDRYDSVANLRSFARPVMVVVSENDSIVPARFGRALFDSLAAPRKFLTIPGAEHDDWADRVDEKWWCDVLAFLIPLQQ